MLRGDLIVPPEGAFGGCFTRHAATHPRPELGMSEDSFLVAPYTVTGLAPDSAAARSGLREGDAIVSFTGVSPRVAHSAANVSVGPMVEIVVEREGKPQLFSFATAGAPMVEYGWTLKPKRPAACVL
jgi:predicted metalloprotease with PDZ domain